MSSPAEIKNSENIAVSSGDLKSSRNWPTFLWLLFFAGILLAILLIAPPRLGQNNEQRMAEYVTDAVSHGNWICQKDADGNIASKPPMFCWISSAATLLVGEINRFTLSIPSALSALFLSWIVFLIAKKQFGWRAGFLSGSIYLISNVAVNEMATSRFDSIFTLFVTLGAIAAFRGWMTGRGWTWFWLAAAGATLTKGPLGIILSAAGLLAIFFEKRDSKIPIHGSHWIGIIFYLLISGGWFALSYWKFGHALVDKMIFQELVGHAAGNGNSHAGFYKPFLWFLTDFGPWSFVALFSFWRIWKFPANDSQTRFFERFLFCWFVVGLFLFSIAGHDRSRLIFPIVPAAALLAGNELARWTKAFSIRALVSIVTIAAIAMLGAVGFYYFVKRPKSPGVIENIQMQQCAKWMQKNLGTNADVKQVDTPFPLRFYLKDFRVTLSNEEAAKLLKEKPGALVTVKDFEKFTASLDSTSPPIYVVARWPETGEAKIQILSNQPLK